MHITPHDYFRAYPGHPDITPEIEVNAEELLRRVNALREEAAADGVRFDINPRTGTYISGDQNGGFRPRECPIGARTSPHKDGQGVDNYDPLRTFASWCMAHHDRLRAHGLWMERPEWTPTWTHLQSRAPGSGLIAFVPSTAAPLTGPPPVWA